MDFDGGNQIMEKRRTSKACIGCHRSHLSCEEERPCSRCIKRRIPCEEYVQRKKGRRKKDEEQIYTTISPSDSISPLLDSTNENVPIEDLQPPIMPDEQPIDLPDDIFSFFFPSTQQLKPFNKPEEFRSVFSHGTPDDIEMGQLLIKKLSPEQWKEMGKQMLITQENTLAYLRDSGREHWANDRSLFTKYVQEKTKDFLKQSSEAFDKLTIPIYAFTVQHVCYSNTAFMRFSGYNQINRFLMAHMFSPSFMVELHTKLCKYNLDIGTKSISMKCEMKLNREIAENYQTNGEYVICTLMAQIHRDVSGMPLSIVMYFLPYYV